MTRSAVSSLTRPRVSAFSARETVPGCTFAARATSRRVTGGERTAGIMQTFAARIEGSAGPPSASAGADRLVAPELPDCEVDLGARLVDLEAEPRRGTERPAHAGDLVQSLELGRRQHVIGRHRHRERRPRDLVM